MISKKEKKEYILKYVLKGKMVYMTEEHRDI